MTANHAAPKKAIKVLPRLAAECVTPAEGAVCISITNPRQSPAHLDGWAEVLRLGFHDAEKSGGMFTLMPLSDAGRILDFVRKHGLDADLLVHCEFGASRSVAVGLFLAAWSGRPVELLVDGLVHNTWVMRQLRLAAVFKALRWRDAALLKVAAFGLPPYESLVQRAPPEAPKAPEVIMLPVNWELRDRWAREFLTTVASNPQMPEDIRDWAKRLLNNPDVAPRYHLALLLSNKEQREALDRPDFEPARQSPQPGTP